MIYVICFQMYVATKIDLVTLPLEGKYSVFRYGCGERATVLNLDKKVVDES